MDAEEAEQRVTYLLQEIDANICAAHRSATQICATVRRHHQLQRQIHEAAQLWRPLFASFSAPAPASRRSLAPSARTPARARAAGFLDASEGLTGASRALGDAQETPGGRQDADEDDRSSAYTHDPSTGGSFKTTTLKRHAPAASPVDGSVDSSLLSEPAPRMTHTPLLAPRSPVVQDSTSHSWIPSMGSPPRSGRPRTPTSAISSVAQVGSPGVSKNLMKMGAFEYTPPRPGSHRTARGVDEEDSSASVTPPDFSTVKVAPPSDFKRRSVLTTATTTGQPPRRTEQQQQGSGRKRGRSPVPSPVYPKTHFPSDATPAFPSPAKYPSMRRKYSAADYSTPSRKRRRPEPQPTPSQPGGGAAGAADGDEDEDPLTPDFDLTSPLLHTKLKAMTPNTPLSNRLVGANLDVGSVSQEAVLQDYDDSFSAGEPAPEFRLDALPPAFQSGAGAVQISTLYSKFQADGDALKPALSVGQLEERLPAFNKRKIEILLDALVSRRLLRPFVVEGTMFWQVPA